MFRAIRYENTCERLVVEALEPFLIPGVTQPSLFRGFWTLHDFYTTLPNTVIKLIIIEDGAPQKP